VTRIDIYPFCGYGVPVKKKTKTKERKEKKKKNHSPEQDFERTFFMKPAVTPRYTSMHDQGKLSRKDLPMRIELPTPSAPIGEGPRVAFETGFARKLG